MPDRAEATTVDAVLDAGGLGAYQLFVIGLCGALMLIDGVDANIVGFLAPTLAKTWHLDPGGIGLIFTAGVVSSAMASLVNGPIADRRGRRTATILYTLLFGVASVASAYANDGTQFAAARFIAGFGLGGLLPNALALGVEFVPARNRGFTAVVLFSFFGVGQALGGFITAALLASRGWRTIVLIGGIIPLGLAAALYFVLPESIRYLAQHPAHRARAAALLRRIRPGVRIDGEIVEARSSAPGTSRVGLLFADGRATLTIALLLMSGINNAEIAFLMYWLPTVVTGAGFTIGIAVLATTVMVFSGILANMIFGRLIDRIGHFRILAAANMVGVLALLGFGAAIGRLPLMLLAAGFTGAGVIGFQAAINSLAASFYPTEIRSTGCGWVIAAGRLFGIAGPMIGAALLALRLAVPGVFAVNAAITALAGLVVLVAWRLRAGGGAGAPVIATTALSH